MDGRLIPQKMKPDTLILNTDTQRVTKIWRIMLNAALPVRAVEARYETAPEQLPHKCLPLP
ncbi:Hypothetical protein ROD_20741 [Citrobacter rodentium ICC168]|jgi:hypothetical protein|uniref:Uncharacterized protein n=1 Tax=Citrobacter rodentium (strain ICC168) TaxID=637910 RepID=D2TPK8_CITRI|nr:Hypothetical protein ROD_20741 [Citrobacter rodentium ICC168]